MFLPTRKDLVRQGINFPARKDDMNLFVKGIGTLPQSAYVDNYNLRFGPIANEVRDRVTQAIVGELNVDKRWRWPRQGQGLDEVVSPSSHARPARRARNPVSFCGRGLR